MYLGILALLGAACAAYPLAASESVAHELGWHSLTISPDGRFVTFVRQPRLGEASSPGEQTLWMLDAEGNTTRAIITAKFPAMPVGPSPQWSPDGRLLSFLTTTEDEIRLKVWDRGLGREIWQAKEPVSTSLDDVRPYWTPDSRFVLFVADGQAHRPSGSSLPNEDPRVQLDAQLTGAMPSPSGMTILRSPQLRARLNRAEPVAASDGEQSTPGVVTRKIAALDVNDGTESIVAGGAPIEDFQMTADGRRAIVTAADELGKSLYALSLDHLSSDSAPPGRLRLIARGVRAFKISVAPSGRFIAYAADYAHESPGELFVVDTADGSSKRVGADVPARVFPDDEGHVWMGDVPFLKAVGNFGFQALTPFWTQDERELVMPRAILRRDASVPIGYELWRIPRDGAGARRIPLDPEISVVALAGCADLPSRPCVTGRRHELVAKIRLLEDNSIAIAAMDIDLGTIRILRRLGKLPVGENVRQIDWAMRSWTMSVATGAGVAIHADETPEQPPELWRYELNNRASSAQFLKALNPRPVISRKTLQRVTWTTAVGDTLGASLQLPSNMRAGERVPVVMYVYPFMGDSREGFMLFEGGEHSWDPLIEKGRYAVLVPDLPVTRGAGTVCEELTDNAVAALDAAIKTGYVDGSRTGLFGYSYGGYLVNCIVTGTQRFRAAVSGAGWGDVVEQLFAITTEYDGKAFPLSLPSLGKFDGYPWDVPQQYTMNSPIYHLDKVETPLFLVYGKKDLSLFREQARAMYMGLSRLQRPVQLVAYDGADHHEAAHHPDLWPRVLDWFALWFNQNEIAQPHASVSAPLRSSSGRAH